MKCTLVMISLGSLSLFASDEYDLMELAAGEGGRGVLFTDAGEDGRGVVFVFDILLVVGVPPSPKSITAAFFFFLFPLLSVLLDAVKRKEMET